MVDDVDDAELAAQVRAAAARDEVRTAVAGVYGDLQRGIDARRPACSASGRCCRFEEFGHRLYVTTMELAAFVSGLSDRAVQRPGGAGSRWDGTGCPFQSARLCGAHEIRPFGCRVYFCDPTAGEWQNDMYERTHASLKRLHEELGVPYRYVEWRWAIRNLGLVHDAGGGPVQVSPARRPLNILAVD